MKRYIKPGITWMVLILASLGALASGAALAQAWPARTIRIIVPFPPGGGNDVVGRLIAQKLTERLGQQVVVDNRAGANGIVGLQALMQAAPDGYTLGVGAAGPIAVNPALYDKLPYEPLRDFAPIANVANFPLLLVTHPSVAAKTTRELVALAKAKPGTLHYSSPGSGNSGHLAGELFNTLAGVKTVHVPYKGQGPAITDLIAGQVQMLYSSIPSVLPHVKQGQLTAIAVGNATRLASLPDIPTIAESGVPGYEAYSWAGILAPAGTPRDIVARLSREIADILKQKDVSERLLSQGAIPVGDSPEQFAAYIKAEMEKWGAVVRAANIKME